MKLILEYPYWFLLFCVALGFLFAYLLYGKKAYIFHEQENPNLKRLLFSLRFLAVSLLSFLLLSPLIKTKSTQKELPTIILLQDNSNSLSKYFSPTHKEEYQEKLNQLIKQLSKNYLVKAFSFGSSITNYKTLTFKDQETNIDNAIQEAIIQHDNQNIGAIILASDGIYNVGNNPVYNPFSLRTSFYTIGLGDTTTPKDALIKSLLYPDVVYLGDQFNIQIDIEANRLNGKTTVLEVVDNNGKIILNQTIAINQDNFYYTTNVIGTATIAGVLSYKVSLKTISGELIKENNFDAAYIEVVDGRQKVLLLYDVPHPDIKAIRYAIESNKNYSIDVVQTKEYKNNLNEYDLLILHGIPSSLQSINLATLQSNTKPTLYIVSAQTNLNSFNTIQPNIKIVGSATNGNDVSPTFQSNFSKFTFSQDNLNIFKQLPPLLAPHGKYDVKPTADILFQQQLGKVATNNPLVVCFDENGKRSSYILAEGIWRWRINEYQQYTTTNATDELINKLVQFLTVKTDKRKFKVQPSKKIFNANENVVLEAQLYNESFVLINEPEVSAIIKGNSKEYKYVFNKSLNAYQLTVGVLPVGDYAVMASTNFKGKSYKAGTNFSVKPILLEQQQTQANWNVLRTLATQSGGIFYNESNMLDVLNDIQKNKNIHTLLHENFSTQPLIDWKVIFALIVLLLGAEWFVRKYNGVV